MLRADQFGDRFLHCMGTRYLHIKLNVKIGKKGGEMLHADQFGDSLLIH